MQSNDAITALFTVTDFVRWGASRFREADLHFGHGTDNAVDEAAGLVYSALRLDHEEAGRFSDARLTDHEKKTILSLFERRIRDRIPGPYLTGEAWFAGLKFHVDERVLIPRSPMAELIESRFAPWVKPEHVRHVLDLGTGTGCIGIASAYAFPKARVDATDVCASALEVARRNIAEHGLKSRVEAIQSDYFQALGEKRYDLIISNPPYVSECELAGLPAEYHHEPRSALAAGNDGLDAVRIILREAGRHLADGGALVVEVGATAPAVMSAFPELPFLWLEFERGGEGVFLLTAAQLQEPHAAGAL